MRDRYRVDGKRSRLGQWLVVAAVLWVSTAPATAQLCVKVTREPEMVVMGGSGDGGITVGFIFDVTGSVGAIRSANQPLRLVGPSGTAMYGISGDGGTIVGSSATRVARWLGVNGVAEPLQPQMGLVGYGRALAASWDGSVIVGEADLTGLQTEAFRWTEATGMMESLGAPLTSVAYDVSASGDVVVGSTMSLYGAGEPFVWTSSNGLVLLPGIGSSGIALAVSADGGVVVGKSFVTNTEFRAFVWTQAGGLLDPLSSVPANSRFTAVSNDGQTAYGTVDDGGQIRPIAWSHATGLVELLPGLPTDTSVTGFTDGNGTVLANQSNPTGGHFAAVFIPTTPIGVEACAASALNSIGCQARMSAVGSSRIADGDFTLRADGVPAGAFGMFLAGRSFDEVPLATSAGPLCLGGAIGRFSLPGQIVQSSSAGSFALSIDLTALPQPNGSVAAQVGSTWTFQAWYRDQIPGHPPSNTSTAIAVTLR